MRDDAMPIAIIGASYRLPSADGPDAYWRVLDDGIDCVRDVPADRWNADAHYDADPSAIGKSNSRWGGFLEDVAAFDAALFRMSRVEALSTDPQHRLLLEATWLALEDAALDPTQIGVARAAVITAIGANEHQPLRFPDPASFNSYTTVGNIASLAANRISHFFDLRGPSFAVDTGCSSALVALHLACASLRAGDVDLAIVGAANTLLRPDANIAASKAWALSTTGHCHFLDVRGDGYVRSEGAGAFVLARLQDAEARGDRVLGIVRATAVNHDGRASALTSPSREAIADVMQRAVEKAGLESKHVGYVEAHGVGSASTDGAEVSAIAAALAPQRLPIGSAKGNLGHLEPASGIAAIGKILLAFEHGKIPRQLHHETPRDGLDLEALGVFVPKAPVDWPRAAVPRVALVNGFGLGGTNACVVLEEPPARDDVSKGPFALVLSARTAPTLRTLAATWADAIAARPLALASLAAVAERSRAGLALRLRIVSDDASTMVARLREFAAGGELPNDTGSAPSRTRAPIATGIHAPSYPFERRDLGTLPRDRRSDLQALLGARVRTPIAARQTVATLRRDLPELAGLVTSAGLISPALHLWRAMRIAEERGLSLVDVELPEALAVSDTDVDVALVVEDRSFSVTSPAASDDAFLVHARGAFATSGGEIAAPPPPLEGGTAAQVPSAPAALRWVARAVVARGAADFSIARPIALAGMEGSDPTLVEAALQAALFALAGGGVPRALTSLQWSKDAGSAREIRARENAARVDVFFVDAEGRTVALIRGLDATASANVTAAPRTADVPSPAVEQGPRRPREIRALVESSLRDLLGLDPTSALPPRAGFTELGLTSLAMVELRRVLSTSLGITLPATVAFDRPNLETLTAYLAERVAPALSKRDAPPPAELAAEVLDDLDGLSDAEANALLEAYDTDQRRPT